LEEADYPARAITYGETPTPRRLNNFMALPITTHQSPKTKINSDKASTHAPTKAEIVNSNCLEAALACAILAKLATKHGEQFSKISPTTVLQLIADIRHNRVRVEKANGNELIVREIDTSEDRMRVSIVLKSGSVALLLKLDREDPDKLSVILSSACKELNGPTERKLVKLAKNIHIQSDKISFNKHAADLVLKGDVVILT
jgi:hypothetical protein